MVPCKYTLSTLPHAKPNIKLWETSSKAALTWFDQENLKFYATLVIASRDGCCQFAPSHYFPLSQSEATGEGDRVCF